jgi:hypothetical protein
MKLHSACATGTLLRGANGATLSTQCSGVTALRKWNLFDDAAGGANPS